MRLFDGVHGRVTLVAHCVHKGLIIRELIIGRKVYRQVVGTCASRDGNEWMLPAYVDLRGAYELCVCMRWGCRDRYVSGERFQIALRLDFTRRKLPIAQQQPSSSPKLRHRWREGLRRGGGEARKTARAGCGSGMQLVFREGGERWGRPLEQHHRQGQHEITHHGNI